MFENERGAQFFSGIVSKIKCVQFLKVTHEIAHL